MAASQAVLALVLPTEKLLQEVQVRLPFCLFCRNDVTTHFLSCGSLCCMNDRNATCRTSATVRWTSSTSFAIAQRTHSHEVRDYGGFHAEHPLCADANITATASTHRSILQWEGLQVIIAFLDSMKTDELSVQATLALLQTLARNSYDLPSRCLRKCVAADDSACACLIW